jgi:hypothetical protein
MQNDHEDLRPYVYAVLLLIVSVMLIFAPGCAAKAQAAEPIYYQMVCNTITDHIQEQRACASFYKALRKHPDLEPMEEGTPGGFLWYIVHAGFSERPPADPAAPEQLFVGFQSMLCIPSFEGVCMSVWSNGVVMAPHEVQATMKIQAGHSINIYHSWLDSAIPIFRNLCPDPGSKPRSTEWAECLYEKYADRDTVIIMTEYEMEH